MTDELLAREERRQEEEMSRWKSERRRVAQEIAADPEGSMKYYNAAAQALGAEAPTLSHREVKARLRELSRAHEMPFSNAHLELFARQMADKDFYREHPVHTGWWLLRYSRPGTFKRRWREVKSGTVNFTTGRQ